MKTVPMPLRLQNRMYEQAARLAKLGAWECDLPTGELTWTDGVYDLFELPVGSRPTRAMTVELYAEESRNDMEAARAEVIRSGQGVLLDARITTCRGKSRWMRLSIGVAYDQGQPVRLFGAKQDITAEKQAWMQLRELAERDFLTGLANRAVFDARYRQLIGNTINHGSLSALALIDLDQFKQINDTLGHSAGDECLRQIGLRLRRIFDDAILVARVGGDEFAVLLGTPRRQATITRLLKGASAALCRPIFWNGRRLDVGVSIGAAVLRQRHIGQISALYEEADTALYAAKAAGRCAVRLFGDDGSGDPSAE